MNDLIESDVLEQFQAQWDAHRQRVETIVDAAPRPVVVGRPRPSGRRWLLAANGLLMLVSVAYAVYWALTAGPFAYTLPRQLFAVAFGCFLVCVAVFCGVSLVALLALRPLRVGVLLPLPAHGLRLGLLTLFLVSTFAVSACTPATDDYHLRQGRGHSQSRVQVMDSVTSLLENV